MKNIRRHPVWGSSIKIIILDKKNYFSNKKWHGISQSGERMGREYQNKEKMVNLSVG
jgi:hypothetical protein